MKITPRDWEKLSAYIDDELPKRDRTPLERRLQSEPALQIALEELRRTQKILHQAPRLTAPRDFTLTPEMIGQTTEPRQARLFPTFRMAAILTSVLLAVVLVLDFGRGQMALAPFAMKEEAVEDAVEAPMKEVRNYAEPQAEVMIVEEAEVTVAEGETLGAAPLVAQENIQEEPLTEVMAPEEAEAVEMEKSVATAGADLTDAAPTLVATKMMTTPTAVDEEPISTLLPPTLTSVPQPVEPYPSPQPATSLLGILEAVLGLAALGFGAAAWLTRRKKN